MCLLRFLILQTVAFTECLNYVNIEYPIDLCQSHEYILALGKKYLLGIFFHRPPPQKSRLTTFSQPQLLVGLRKKSVEWSAAVVAFLVIEKLWFIYFTTLQVKFCNFWNGRLLRTQKIQRW